MFIHLPVDGHLGYFQDCGCTLKAKLEGFAGGEAVTYYRKGRVTNDPQLLHFNWEDGLSNC